MGKHADGRALEVRFGIDLDLLIPSEHRDPEDALLAAASDAFLNDAGVLPLDLLFASDAAAIWETRV
jgi:hypothetical protein